MEDRMGNKYGRHGVPVPWDAIKTLWCTGEKTCKEIGQIFGVVPNTITTRSLREKWHKVRDKVLSRPQPSVEQKAESDKAEIDPEHLGKGTFESIPNRAKITTLPLGEEVIVQRARMISGSDSFRSRVIAVNEKALAVLENNEPTNVSEVDRFAEALTKVERVGARTYGYDREAERPIINIGVLAGGNEYE
jgi:hypothetical protein